MTFVPKVVQRGAKHDNIGTPAGPYNHGNGGLFAQNGTDTRIFSAMQLPEYGLISALPVLRDPLRDAGEYGGYTSPLYSTFTGVTQGAAEDIDNQPTEPCQDGPEGGLVKLCTLSSPFGRFRFKIKPIDLETVGDLRDTGDVPNQRIANPINPMPGFGAPGVVNSTAQILRNEFMRRAFETTYSAARMLAQRIYVGNPANSTGSNYWKDIVGLDIHINTGNKRDVFTNNLCTALNSFVHNFGFNMLNGNGPSIVQTIESMINTLRWNARHQGLDPVQWVIVMRPELWDEIVKVWPVRQYYQAVRDMSNMGSAGSVSIAADVALSMQNRMRDGMMLPIGGREYAVILDEFIPETDPNENIALTAGQYASDIYIVPMTVMGGIPVTYIEPYNMANDIAESIVNEGRLVSTFTTDGGIWRWYTYERAGCVSWSFATRFRLKMHTPQLGGRITNVSYSPMFHFRSADPESAYFVNGGRTTGVAQKFYTEWGGNTPQQF